MKWREFRESSQPPNVEHTYPLLRLESLHFLCSSNRRQQFGRQNGVAAFCACCGAEITLKAEPCPVCGAPQHGMAQPDLLLTLDVDADPSQEDVRIGRKLSEPPLLKRQ
jgi:hypothetical protein